MTISERIEMYTPFFSDSDRAKIVQQSLLMGLSRMTDYEHLAIVEAAIERKLSRKSRSREESFLSEIGLCHDLRRWCDLRKSIAVE